MVIRGFDSKVAEEHGFRIVTRNDGTQTSIPVTASAKVLVAATPAGPAKDLLVSPQSRGNCGTDFVQTYADNAKGGIQITTGYTTDGVASVYHVWSVQGNTLAATFTEDFTGFNASTYWTAKHFRNIPGGASGQDEITPGSHANLINGAQCYALPAHATW